METPWETFNALGSNISLAVQIINATIDVFLVDLKTTSVPPLHSDGQKLMRIIVEHRWQVNMNCIWNKSSTDEDKEFWPILVKY